MDVATRKAEFTTKPGVKCDLEEVKKAIADAGVQRGGKFEVTKVQSSPAS